MAKDVLMYKGKPLVRSGNTIYYGYMDQPLVAIMQIASTKEFQGQEVADKVYVQLFKTDPAITKLKDKIVKKAERIGLYSALELSTIWLERELEKELKSSN
ncbi:MAG: hypothetical protein IJL77_05960 [Clostridia bacterium]|nr:hypothetical protein [Clostridia bacterium]